MALKLSLIVTNIGVNLISMKINILTIFKDFFRFRNSGLQFTYGKDSEFFPVTITEEVSKFQ